MAREPSICHRTTRKGAGYFCIVRGERHKLALGPEDRLRAEV